MGAFHCHATDEFICHGWAVVHGRQPHEREPLAFRLWGIDPSTVNRRIHLLGQRWGAQSGTPLDGDFHHESGPGGGRWSFTDTEQ
jgi:hypothetical protein